MDQEAVNFFQEKKSWSRYKDLILDYYLKPYLAKVSHLGKPILIVDCFAGPGKFKDDEIGSPLIISNHLEKYSEKDIDVKGFFIEKEGELFSELEENLKRYSFPAIARKGSFQSFVDELSGYARSHTVFVYADPIKPSHLSFNDLRSVYDHLGRSGQSIECLINFLSRGFLRATEGIRDSIVTDEKINVGHNNTVRWDAIAGGDYWHEILLKDLPLEKKVDLLADGYSVQLERWFKYVLKYPIREKYKDNWPKYHLIFGSRHPDAVDLINRAMVRARREFVGARFIKGNLFPNQPKEEVVDEQEIANYLLSSMEMLKKTNWKMLRIQTTLLKPCMYTDSEFNRSIKKLIKDRVIKSNCEGNKRQEDAELWL